eukprot:TRINITY_DN25155_c0_g1_i1.p1 TRINITY_DN25155_c0_g1~~TRINITY_DN25155_c0_g1_i1.p1  ORF type:complete len:273 (-),score=27.25 TRINITY_DN25155_c0_g1_i1:4-822(-)
MLRKKKICEQRFLMGTFINLNQKQVFLQKIYELMDEFDERTFTQIFFGLAGSFWQDHFLLNILCQKTLKFVQNSEIQDIKLKTAIGVLGNLIKFNFYNKKIYNIFIDIILNKFRDISCSDLVYFLSAFGYAEKNIIIKNEQIQNVFKVSVDLIEQFFEKFNQMQVIQILKAIAYTKLELEIDKNLVSRFLEKLINFKFFSIFQSVDLICAIAKLQEKELLSSYEELISYLLQFIEKSNKKGIKVQRAHQPTSQCQGKKRFANKGFQSSGVAA